MTRAFLLVYCFLTFLVISVQAWSNPAELHQLQQKLKNVNSVTILLSVNDTWDENGCITTVKTNPMVLDRKYLNASQYVMVGKCDHGLFNVSLVEATDGQDAMTLDLLFYSSVIEDAEPPSCQIGWNGTYLAPAKPGGEVTVLPSCYTTDSREGWYLTYYWFYLLDWSFA